MKIDSWIKTLYTYLELYLRLTLLNVLWVIFNLPTLFVAVNTIIARSNTELIVFSILLTLCVPIFIFPATMALFSSVRMLVRKESTPLIRMFWRDYKSNYGSSLLGGILFTIIWIIFIVDYIFFGTQVHNFFTYIFLAIFLFLFMFTMYYFAIKAHFNVTFFQGFKNAFLITLKNPIITIMTAVTNIVIIVITYKLSPIIIFLSTIAIVAAVSFNVFYKISLKGI